MIFASIGLLVVALVFLIAGILRSSVALLTLSVVATLVACVLLWASFAYYRRKALDEGAAPEDLEVRPGWPSAYRPGMPASAGPPVAGAPGATVQQPVFLTAPATNGRTTADLPAGLAERWDTLPEGDAIDAVDALSLGELHELRRHEIEHAWRKPVVQAIDARIEAIVERRRIVLGGA